MKTKSKNNNRLNWLKQKIEEFVELALVQDGSGIKSKLKEIVPQYKPYES